MTRRPATRCAPSSWTRSKGSWRRGSAAPPRAGRPPNEKGPLLAVKPAAGAPGPGASMTCPECGSEEVAPPSHDDYRWGCWECGHVWGGTAEDLRQEQEHDDPGERFDEDSS